MHVFFITILLSLCNVCTQFTIYILHSRIYVGKLHTIMDVPTTTLADILNLMEQKKQQQVG